MVIYGVRNRPITFASVPKGYVEVGAHPDFRFGTVAYERELAPDEVESYELVKIPTAAEREAFVADLVERMREAGWADFVGEPRYAHAVVGQIIERAALHLRAEEIAAEAFRRLGVKS